MLLKGDARGRDCCPGCRLSFCGLVLRWQEYAGLPCMGRRGHAILAMNRYESPHGCSIDRRPPHATWDGIAAFMGLCAPALGIAAVSAPYLTHRYGVVAGAAENTPPASSIDRLHAYRRGVLAVAVEHPDSIPARPDPS